MFKNLKKQVRPWDYIIILILLIVSFIPLAIFGYSQKQQMAAAADNNTKPIIYAEISIDKKVIKKIKLSKKTPHKLFTLHPHSGEYNIIEVDGTRIRDKEDNTPDQIAVNTGWISKPGQQSICLPHRLIITIKSSNKSATPDNSLVKP
ncbi:NusG domain II-containing protein [Loigolactobacillus coryniformis]|jgi:hypothetical protein|uniref:NusG domain II-containing protein n=1 Tax=Lactobacillaceae TaxID=33958 RepID=UPI0013DD8A85|nr:NusG domain II-containing protein [Levilactobacillus cerevisiae]